MATTRILSLMVALSAAFFVLSCSGSKSEDAQETNFGTGDYRLEFEFVVDGLVERSEVLFDAPESWRVIGDPFLGDVLVVGRQAWMLVNGRWVEDSYDRVWGWLRFRVIDPTIAPQAIQSKGPSLGGESTSRWTAQRIPNGSIMASSLREAADESPLLQGANDAQADMRELADYLDGATGTLEYIVGNETGRVYEQRFKPDDDRLPAATVIVHYEEVTLSRP